LDSFLGMERAKGCTNSLVNRGRTARRPIIQTTRKSQEELDKLWEIFSLDRDNNVREALVLEYLRLVKYVAGRLAIGLPTFVDVDDLFGAGLLGLMQALDKFDRERKIKFETYAVPRIRGAMLDELRSQDWFPRSMRKKAKVLEKAYSEVESRLERAASDEEIAKHMKIKMGEYYALVDEVCLTTLVSLDKEIANSNEGLYAVLDDNLRNGSGPDPSNILEEKELRHIIRESVNQLPDRERTVLNLYYYEELTLKEIGDVLDISESRVCQIHTKAVLRLKGRIHHYTKTISINRLTSELHEARTKKSSESKPKTSDSKEPADTAVGSG
jgi:RNA polymerase sigma factor for flagellar operon FliA